MNSEFESGKMRQSRCCSLVDSLRKDRETNESCDIEIFVEKNKFNAHKNVLISCSDYFRAMFTGGFKEKDKGYVELTEISKDSFIWLLDFMYGADMEFETKSADEIIRTLDVADMFCLDSFVAECQEFVKSWRLTKYPYDESYVIAHKLNLSSVEEDMKAFVFRQLVPPNYLKVKEELDMETVSYDLISDALKMLKKPENIEGLRFRNFEDFWSVFSLKIRLEGIILWIAYHPSEDMNRYLEVLELAQLNALPNFEVGNAISSISSKYMELSFANAATACNVKLLKIADYVSSLKIRPTLVNIKGYTVEVADYEYNEHKWQEFSFHVGENLKLATADGDIVFLIGKNSMYTFDMKRKVLSEKRILLMEQEYFECNKACAKDGIVYILGRNTQSGNVILAMYNWKTDDLSRRELTLAYLTSYVPALTTSNDKVIFKNGYHFYTYQPNTNVLSEIRALNSQFHTVLENKPSLALLDKDLTVFVGIGYFIKNPSTFNNQITPATKPAVGHTSAYTCAINKDVIVALQHGDFNDHIKLLRGNDDFQCVGFLPRLKGFEEPKVHFIMRHEMS